MVGLHNKIFLLATLLWTVLICFFGWQEIQSSRAAIMGLAEAEARASYNKDVVYRRWAAGHGGVYVPVTENTPINQYLQHVEERDVVTPSGRQLTLLNPAYMMRQVHELATEQYGVQGHITSLRPLRPGNEPDLWEQEALESFRDESSVAKTTQGYNGENHLRMMFPMLTEEICLKCHAHQGDKLGGIRGGISVSVPLAPYEAAHYSAISSIFFTHVLIWLLGTVFLIYSRRLVLNQSRVIEHVFEDMEMSEKKYRKLFDEAAHGIGVADCLTGEILACNNMLATMVGLTPRELIGQPQRMLHPPDEQAKKTGDVTKTFKKHRDGDAGEILATQLITKDGKLRDVEIKAVHLNLNGRDVMQGFFYDTTRRNKLQAQAIRASHLASLGELSAGVAHEINNPIGGVINYAEILSQRAEKDSFEGDLLQRIIKEAERIAKIVKNLLSFSRDEGTKKTIVDLRDVLEEALSLIRAQLRKDAIAVEIKIEDGMPPIKCNAHQIEQIIMNLVSNARYSLNKKFSEPHADKKISITATRRVEDGKEWLGLELRDWGCGIPENIIHRVDRPFYTTKPQGEGTGLGLSICTEIVGNHNGRMEIESKEGEYTSIMIVLPLWNRGT